MSAAGSLDTVQSEWARLLAHTLRDAGVRRVIASPGSRSTPILAALLQAELEVHDVIDERSAAFVALGHARARGEPAAVLCTSGTAPAHWYPAVIEASLVGAPMILLSADRPTELSHCGAPQAIDQLQLFGGHVRFFADAGNPEPHEVALVGLRRLVAQAVAISLGPLPGPVHLNLRARKPLEPREPVSAAEHALRALADRVRQRPLPRRAAAISSPDAELDALAERLAASERTLFVAGPLAPQRDLSALLSLVARAGGVLAAEASSQLRYGEAVGARFEGLDAWLAAGLWSAPSASPGALETTDVAPAPTLVVELGGVPTSGAYERWLARVRPARVVFGVQRHIDPHGSAEQLLLGEPAALALALLPRMNTSLAQRPASLAFQQRLAHLDEALRPLLEAQTATWGEPAIARSVLASLPAQGRLVIGNSLPIRVLDRHGLRALRSAPLEVLHQRGANGIDGFVAQSAGAQLAAPRPTVLLVGDVTLLHDAGSLAFARHVRAPLVIVVVDNAGGRIFEALPVARDAAWMMPHMVTTEAIDHGALARAFGVGFAAAHDVASLERALAQGLAQPGVTLVHARVAPSGARALDTELVSQLGAALQALRAEAARPR